MRKLSKLAVLPPADQNHVIDLCSKHPYEHVVTFLEKPRAEGGLDLKTSRSALCRFATTFHPDPDRLAHEIKRLLPLLEATTNSPTLASSIGPLLERHICTQLAADAPFQKVEAAFRFLFKLHREQNVKNTASKCRSVTSLHDLSRENLGNSAFPANPAAKKIHPVSPHL
jgi:hypothetical protein